MLPVPHPAADAEHLFDRAFADQLVMFVVLRNYDRHTPALKVERDLVDQAKCGRRRAPVWSSRASSTATSSRFLRPVW